METDSIKALTNIMLTEREVIIYQLIESGMTTRDVAERIGVSHESVRTTHKNAADKIKRFGEAGLFATEMK